VDCFGGGQFYCRACRASGNLNAVARCRTLSPRPMVEHGGTTMGKNMGLIVNGLLISSFWMFLVHISIVNGFNGGYIYL